MQHVSAVLNDFSNYSCTDLAYIDVGEGRGCFARKIREWSYVIVVHGPRLLIYSGFHVHDGRKIILSLRKGDGENTEREREREREREGEREREKTVME